MKKKKSPAKKTKKILSTPKVRALLTCVEADTFKDCFSECSGVISGASPGPICGWTFSEAFGALGGSVTFSSGSMSFDTANDTDLPGVVKSMPVSLSTIYGTSGKFKFTEYPTTPTAGTAYTFNINNFDVSEVIVFGLYGDGGAVFQFGDPAAASNYVGTWTPDNGTHEVAWTLDSLGVPRMWIDGVEITLTFVGTGMSGGSYFPGDIVAMFICSGDSTPATAPVSNFFVTTGIQSPETEYCCP